jgi:DNA recombination protein RmuC
VTAIEIGIGLVILLAVAVLLFWLARTRSADLPDLGKRFERIDAALEQFGRSVREDLSRSRSEASSSAHQLRDELGTSLKNVGDTLNQHLATLTHATDERFERLRDAVEKRLQGIQEANEKKLEHIRREGEAAVHKTREEVAASLKSMSEVVVERLADASSSQRQQLGTVVEQLIKLSETTDARLTAQSTSVDERLRQGQLDGANASKQLREEVAVALKGFGDSVHQRMEVFSIQLGKLTESNQQRLDALKTTVEEKLKTLQEDNSKQLDRMRTTVDEKLQGTLEKRLGESFKLVSERLELVHKGLGEMQVLATGVGDLKKVLTNVKTRGTWAEVQLGALLEQILSPGQFDKNVATKGGNERVEFAVKLPGRTEDKQDIVWLPLDAKFPVEDYRRLVGAQEQADAAGAEAAGKQLEASVKACAADIHEKYLSPPRTTDFGIMFLPTEGLYAEVVRRTALVEDIQRRHRVVVAGPTTLAAILNSLQMGFDTLKIQKQSSEIWALLGNVKVEFDKYEMVLKKVQKKLTEASETIETEVGVRTRAIQRKLRGVPEAPASPGQPPLLLVEAEEEDIQRQESLEQEVPSSERGQS